MREGHENRGPTCLSTRDHSIDNAHGQTVTRHIQSPRLYRTPWTPSSCPHPIRAKARRIRVMSPQPRLEASAIIVFAPSSTPRKEMNFRAMRYREGPTGFAPEVQCQRVVRLRNMASATSAASVFQSDGRCTGRKADNKSGRLGPGGERARAGGGMK